MQAYANFSAPSNVPIVEPRPKPAPADLVDDVLEKLRATCDPERQVELLSLGIDVLKRRQTERTPRKAAR